MANNEKSNFVDEIFQGLHISKKPWEGQYRVYKESLAS